MKKTIIAFDVDGTLVKTEPYGQCTYIPNIRIVTLLKTLSRFKNIDIIVWSGGGKEHCEKAVEELGLKNFVKKCYSKNHSFDKNGKHIFKPDIVPDIAIDDCHSCVLGLVNLIVHTKGEWKGVNL